MLSASNLNIERCRDQVSVWFRLQEQTVLSWRRKLDTELNTATFWIGLFRMDMEIREITVSKCDEMAECAEIWLKLWDTLIVIPDVKR